MANHEIDDGAISDVDGSSLFSASDSDIIDSPADGYFSQRSHPQQLYVQNEGSNKAQEAVRSPRSHAPASIQPHVWAPEQTPLLDAGPAPPDYYAATADRRMNGDHDHGVRNYGSIEDEYEDTSPRHTPRVLLQAGLFGGHREPQSMSSNTRIVDEENQMRPQDKKASVRDWRRWARVCVKKQCLGVIIAVIVIVFFVLLGFQSSEDESITEPYPNDPEVTPTPTQPGDDSSNPHIPHDNLPTHPALPGCSYSTFSQFWHYDFNDISNFTFEEHLHKFSTEYSLGGSVWIRPAPDDQIPDVRVSVSFVTSAGTTILDPHPAITDDSIILGMPITRTTDTDSTFTPCIDAGIAIDVKQGVELENWMTKTTSFNIFALAQLFDEEDFDAEEWLSVQNASTLSTDSGKIDASYWSSRKTIISTRSGSIHGNYALRDLLSITSRAGAVTVKVDPRDADKEKPVPAVFTATTTSGMIHAEFPKEKLPDRDYETSVETSSGSVSGSYIHGTKSEYRTNAGSIVTSILPFNTTDNSTLTTSTLYGSTSVHMLNPYGGVSLKQMHSKHESRGSGSVNLHYPDEWEGSFDAKSTTGSITVRGRDVKTDWSYDLGFLGGKRVAGRKGTGDSFIEVSTRPGSIVLDFASMY